MSIICIININFKFYYFFNKIDQIIELIFKSVILVGKTSYFTCAVKIRYLLELHS